MDNYKEHTYFIKGMHCASCEILIEKKLLGIKNIKFADASVLDGKVFIKYDGNRPEAEELNRIFKKENYIFSDKEFESEINSNAFSDAPGIIFFSILIIGLFFILRRFGIADLAAVGSSSSLPAFFIFGLLAGVSSCAALVGGIVLSLSKQWTDLYQIRESFWAKMKPHFIFNAGRIVSYFLGGIIFGLIGAKLQISLEFTSLLVVVISTVMIILGLQMIGLKYFRGFQIRVPKFISRYAANESNFKGRYMPFILGALTLLLPCGFTITAEGMAVISGNALRGGLIMLFFSLGTLIPLLIIGFSSVKFSENKHWAGRFLKIAGIVVIFFALYNINNQMNVLGFGGIDNIKIIPQSENQVKLPLSEKTDDKNDIILNNGVQIIKMEASSSGYDPNYFKVKAGVPVRWEISDVGTSGCTNAIISRELFSGSINLSPGKTVIKEFTPMKPGKYKFSCWMGMISGVIEVVN